MSRALSKNAFATLALSDPDSETESTITKPAPKPKQKKLWKKLDLAILPESTPKRPGPGPAGHQDRHQRQDRRRFVGPPKREFRRTKDGRLVLVGPTIPKDGVPKPDIIRMNEFPTLNGKPGRVPTPVVIGTWAQGVQSVLDAKNIEAPIIERKRTALTTGQSIAASRNREEIYSDSDEEEDKLPPHYLGSESEPESDQGSDSEPEPDEPARDWWSESEAEPGSEYF
jgi:hypothetical protein